MQKYYTVDQHDVVTEITESEFNSFVKLSKYKDEEAESSSPIAIMDNAVYINTITEEEILNFFEEL